MSFFAAQNLLVEIVFLYLRESLGFRLKFYLHVIDFQS